MNGKSRIVKGPGLGYNVETEVKQWLRRCVSHTGDARIGTDTFTYILGQRLDLSRPTTIFPKKLQ